MERSRTATGGEDNSGDEAGLAGRRAQRQARRAQEVGLFRYALIRVTRSSG
jgi:hypothetical protein